MSFSWEFVIANMPLYGKAALLTLRLGVTGIIFSLIIGLLCSIVIFYKIRILKTIARVYIELSRNTPLLVQLFFLYYGLPQIGIKLSAEQCAVIGLTFLGGSYMAESFRSGLEAVSKTQLESGLSIGLSKPQLIRYIILPQAFSVALPSLGANGIFLLKETSLFSVVALADLVYVAKELMGMYYATNEALTMLVISYLIILLPISLLLSRLERSVRHAEFGN